MFMDEEGGEAVGKPLQDVTVVDVTANIAGPSVTMILGDLGAEVIKVERPGRGDDARGMGPHIGGESCYFLNINRNKKSVVIDIRTPQGRDLLYRLIEQADVFVENFRYGKAEQLGFGYEQLKRLNPSLVYCTISAFGQAGPEREKPGYDGLLQARTGIMKVTGAPGGPSVRAGVSILDQGSALWAAVGVLAALYERRSTGKGQRVTTSLFETGLSWVGYHLLAYLATGQEPEKMGAGHAAFAPYDAYPTADEELLIGVSNDNLFAKLATALGKEEWLSDERYATNLSRVRHRKELDREIIRVLQTRTAAEWLERLSAAGVPCSRVTRIGSLLDDPQVEAVGMLQEVEHPALGKVRLPRLPVQLSESAVGITSSPPLLGQHTEEVLAERLGLTREQIEALEAQGVIQTWTNK
jgi:crotonobetainyl-CoA:carnitine CoA-transferase CaiB-like acyl-CoA transferase